MSATATLLPSLKTLTSHIVTTENEGQNKPYLGKIVRADFLLANSGLVTSAEEYLEIVMRGKVMEKVIT